MSLKSLEKNAKDSDIRSSLLDRYSERILHDLLPVPYTDESLDNCIQKLKTIQDYLELSVFIENPSSYLSSVESTYSEAEFLRILAQESSCGILLDVNNVYVSSENHGFDPVEMLQTLKNCSVGYFHLAGHTPKDGYILDSHIGPIPEKVWNLFKQAVQIFGPRPTLIEWDEEIPDFATLLDEVEKCKGLISDSIKKSEGDRV